MLKFRLRLLAVVVAAISFAAAANAQSVSKVAVSPTSVTGGANATGTITLSAAASGAVTVTLTSSNAAATVPPSVTVPTGSKTQTFSIATKPVATSTGVTITAKLAKSSATAKLTVAAPTALGLTLSPTLVGGGGNFTGVVTLSGSAPSAGIKVTLSSSSATATVPKSIVVPSGSTSATFSGTTKTVKIATVVKISAAAGGKTVTATLDVAPLSLASLNLAPASVAGGDTTTATLTLNATAPAGGIAAGLTTTSPNIIIPGNITIPAGQISGQFLVTTTAVSKATSGVIVATSNKTTVRAVLGLTPAVLQTLILTPSSIVGGFSVTGRVNLDGQAPTGSLVVALSSNSSIAAVPASVTVPAGLSTAPFAINTQQVSASTPAVISATLGTKSATATLTLLAPTLIGITLNPTALVGGATSTGTVYIGSQAAAGGLIVALKSSSASATVPTSVTIAANATSGTFTVQTTRVPAQTTATITATLGTISLTASLTVNAPTLSTLTLNPTTVVGGVSSTGTVTISSPAPAGGLPISLQSNSASATVPTNFSIAAGSTSGNFTAQTLPVAVQTVATVTATLGTASLTASLTLNPPTLVTLTLNPTSLLGGADSTGTVTISSAAPTGGLQIALTCNAASVTIPGSLPISAGATTGSFAVQTVPIGTPAKALITASFGSKTLSATLTINACAISGLSISPTAVTAPTLAIGTVTLNEPAPAGGFTVALSSNATAAQVPASVVVLANATSATFAVTPQSVLTAVKATITGKDPNAITATAQITVNPYLGLANAPWPKYKQGLSNTSVGKGTGAVGVRAWNVNGEGALNSVTAGQNQTIYGCSYNGFLVAINHSGTMTWSFQTNDVVNSTPAFGVDGTIYVGSDDGSLYAVTPSGTKKWSFQTGGPVRGKEAVGSDGTIYFGSNDGQFYALNPSGTKKWSFPTGGAISQGVALASDNTAYFYSLDGNLYAVNSDGSMKWSLNIGDTTNPYTPVVGPDGTVYISDSGAASGTLFAVNSSTGLTKWSVSKAAITACATGADGTIYIGAGDDNLYAFNPDGTQKWAFNTGNPISCAPVVAPTGSIDVGSSSVLDQITSSGALSWSSYSGPEAISCTVAADGTVVAAGVNLPLNSPIPQGALFAYSSNGTAAWTLKTELTFAGQASIGSDGTVYVSRGDDGYLYAMNPDGSMKWFSDEQAGIAPVTICADGTLYITGGDGELVALKPDGTPKWSLWLIDPTVSQGLWGGPALEPDGTILVTGTDGHLYAVSHDATLKWTFTTAGSMTCTPAIGPDGTIYVEDDTNLYAVTPAGVQKWVLAVRTASYPDPWLDGLQTSPVVGSDGTIYVLAGKNLSAVSPAGVVVWTTPIVDAAITNYNVCTPTLGADGTIYVGTALFTVRPAVANGGKLFAINPTGTVVWSYTQPGGGLASPSIGSDGTLYTSDQLGNAYAISSSGKLIWRLRIPGLDRAAAPSIGPDGSLYYGGQGFFVVH